MNILINKIEVKKVDWSDLNAGSLFKDPCVIDSPLYLKTNEGDSICLLTGEVEDQFLPDHQVIDITNDYAIIKL
jgi:hypothetical protein